jgi:hypothetical protein
MGTQFIAYPVKYRTIQPKMGSDKFKKRLDTSTHRPVKPELLQMLVIGSRKLAVCSSIAGYWIWVQVFRFRIIYLRSQ